MPITASTIENKQIEDITFKNMRIVEEGEVSKESGKYYILLLIKPVKPIWHKKMMSGD